MNIESISVSNFRRISNNITIDLDHQTIIVGKNNTGKTSVSEIMTKCLTSESSFKFEDYSSGVLSSNLINELYSEYETLVTDNAGKPLSKEQLIELEEKIPSITLELLISVEETDNLADIKDILFEFDNNSKVIIRLKHKFSNLKKCVLMFNTYNNSIAEKNKKRSPENQLDFLDFYFYVKRNFDQFFSLKAYSSKPDKDYEMPVDVSSIRSLFNIGVIAAQRKVDDTSDQSSQSLSGAVWNYYVKITKELESLDNEDEYKNSIQEIQNNLNDNYNIIFNDLIKQVNENILLTDADVNVKIESEFNIEDVLKKNSKLKYTLDQLVLPESYNGLGYSNLMYMFIQIITFKNKIEKENRLFNILFIEEPESHLHPQMQSTFLHKVEDILRCNCYINTIITTHSSYILQSANLDNIRYFLIANNAIKIKSLKTFFGIKGFESLKTFLTKYFKINTCDLFFTDKAILIEGATERILMPIFKSMIDKSETISCEKITKQHVTTLEVGGAYAHKFYELLNFLEVKTLIITDIDSVSGNYNSTCKCDLNNEGTDKSKYQIKTSNQIIKQWFNAAGEKLYIKDMLESHNLSSPEEREVILTKCAPDGSLVRLAFQLPIGDDQLWGRTFEEEFIKENSDYLSNGILAHLEEQASQSIKGNQSLADSNISSLIDAIEQAKIIDNLSNITKEILENNIFEIVSKINKTNFAFDLLMLDGWILPQYIKEGLEWLKK